MKTSGNQRKENIINNIEYIMRSRGETKVSFANRTGVTRATLYKILEGKVNNVQQATITRIADFFGVTCNIIENHDLEQIEFIEKTLSPEGDKNPAAVPVIPQTEFLSCFKMRIGFLATQYPVTWYFGDVSNMVALRVEKNIKNLFFPEDILIIRRHICPSNKQLGLFYSEKDGIYFRQSKPQDYHIHKYDETLLGAIVEERVSLN